MKDVADIALALVNHFHLWWSEKALGACGYAARFISTTVMKNEFSIHWSGLHKDKSLLSVYK